MKNRKKGFTIVELVIVIAVIAILAAVLIPNLARLVEKANESKALQEARNTVSSMELEEDGQMPEGTYYIKSGKYYVTVENQQVVANSVTATAPAELGARLYVGNDAFSNVEVYKAGAVSFALRTTDADDSYKGENGQHCTISQSASNVITITVTGTLTKTTSSNAEQGEAYWIGISLPVGYSYNGATPITVADPWLYIKAEVVKDAAKSFTLTKDGVTETYTVKVVLGENGTLSR